MAVASALQKYSKILEDFDIYFKNALTITKCTGNNFMNMP